MNPFIKYPSTKSFRHVVERIVRNKGTLTNVTERFERTVKIHGSNAAVVFNLKTGSVYAQSRNRIVTVENDNAGFAKWVHEHENALREILSRDIELILDHYEDYPDYFVMYGEWCGPGIQKNVAINKIPERIFVVFAEAQVHDYHLEDETTGIPVGGLDAENDNPIYTRPDINMYPITLFGHEYVEIDFTNAEDVQRQLLEDVEMVGNLCPVAQYFGIEGPGEGYVYHGYFNNNYTFKVKSEAHRVAKTKLLKKEYANMAQVEQLVDDICTEARLEQGVEYLKEMQLGTDIKNTGQFISWVIKDTNKEEGDIIKASGLDPKVINSILAKKARDYFTNLPLGE